MNREELAYAAGVIDSDGCISMERSTIRVTVTNTKEELPQWFEQRLGGYTYKQTPKNLRWRTTHYWVIQGEQAIQLLTQIRQWLVIKREQANVAIQYWTETQALRQYVGRGHPRSAELRSFDEGLRARMRVLNRRGATMKEA